MCVQPKIVGRSVLRLRLNERLNKEGMFFGYIRHKRMHVFLANELFTVISNNTILPGVFLNMNDIDSLFSTQRLNNYIRMLF